MSAEQLGAVISLAKESNLQAIFDNLANDEELLQFLQTKEMIGKSNITQMKSKMQKDGSKMSVMLFEYAKDYCTLTWLERFWQCVDSYGSDNSKPRMCATAKAGKDMMCGQKPRSALSEHQLADKMITSNGTSPLNGTECATGPSNGPFNFVACSSSTIGRVTALNDSIEKHDGGRKMQALNEIYCYWRDSSATAPLELKLPRNLSLEKKFDNLLLSIKDELCRLSSSGLDAKLSRLCDLIALKCRRKRVHEDCLLGPVTPEAAYTCIVNESHIFDPVVVHQVIGEMENANLKSELEGYEKDLQSVCHTTFTSNSHPTISLQPSDDSHAHVAVRSSEERVLLSLINNMKYYFKEHLKLDDIVFEGYRNGCIIVFFTISKQDIPHFRLIILSLAQDLQKQFYVTHLIVFNHFVCDLEQKTIIDTQRLFQLLEKFPSKPDDLSIGKKIGKGSNYSVVHKGKYQGKDVAVKIIPDLLFDVDNEYESEKEVHKFLKEVQLLKQIGHEHIVRYLEAFYDRDAREPMLVMELMSKTLKAYLKEHKKTLILSKQVNICLQIAEGVKFLHHQQPPLAHRDLTDTNVLVSEDGTFKIGNLGQAKLKPEVNQRYFSTETPGSLAYMPPEVHGASPHYTESIDIFSLGVLMVEIATQTPPTDITWGLGFRREFERREADLKLMGERHPLRGFVVQCLVDNYKDRPSIDEVVDPLSMLVKHSNQEQAPNNEENADDDSMYKHPTHVVAYRLELGERMKYFLQAARECVEHRDTGKQLLTQVARDLDRKALKNDDTERMAGNSTGIARGVMGKALVGASLRLSDMTARAGKPIRVKGGMLGGGGSMTEAGARFEDKVKDCEIIERATQWTEENKRRSLNTLLKKHEIFQEVLSYVSQNYNESKETCLSTALKGPFGERGAQFTLESFQSAHEQATLVMAQWKTARLQTGEKALASGLLEAADKKSSVAQGLVTTASSTVEVGAETTGAVTRGVVSGVEASAEVGATVGRTMLTVAGGTVVGLSAAFIAINLEILIKTGHDMHGKNKSDTKLAIALQKIEEAVREETEGLRPLANLRQ